MVGVGIPGRVAQMSTMCWWAAFVSLKTPTIFWHLPETASSQYWSR
jgi:hypothetical protein